MNYCIKDWCVADIRMLLEDDNSMSSGDSSDVSGPMSLGSDDEKNNKEIIHKIKKGYKHTTRPLVLCELLMLLLISSAYVKKADVWSTILPSWCADNKVRVSCLLIHTADTFVY